MFRVFFGGFCICDCVFLFQYFIGVIVVVMISITMMTDFTSLFSLLLLLIIIRVISMINSTNIIVGIGIFIFLHKNIRTMWYKQ